MLHAYAPRLVLMIFASWSLSACVVGQHLSLDNSPREFGTVGTGPVSIEVSDQRAAVISGEEKPWTIGQYRAGLGNPWKVSTEGKVPLAEQLAVDLAEELTALGFAPGTEGPVLQVRIEQWDFTGYQNGRFWHALKVNVTDASGKVLATSDLGEEIEIKGTFSLGARGGFERDMPGIYANIINSIVRDNPPVLSALRQ